MFVPMRLIKASRIAAISIGFFLCSHSYALAWGAEGHEIVAAIAQDRLTPYARAQIEAILFKTGVRSNTDMSLIVASAEWADSIKKERPETARWHFVDIPINSSGYQPDRDCPDRNCVVAQIENDEALLADPKLPSEAQADALRFLVHFLGDVHQPLHVADNNDRGGNDVRVVYAGRETNLHALWDNDMFAPLGSDWREVTYFLEHSYGSTSKLWENGTPADWANETFRVAQSDIYRKLYAGKNGMLYVPELYVKSEQQTVGLLLYKAGVRLAWVLNNLFSPGGLRERADYRNTSQKPT